MRRAVCSRSSLSYSGVFSASRLYQSHYLTHLYSVSLIFPVPNWKKCTYEKKKTNCWQFLSKKNRPCWFPTLQWRHIIPRLITWHDLPAAWCPNGHLYGTAHTALLLVLVRTNIFIVKILTMYSFLGSSFLLSICLGCGDTSVLVVPVWDLLSPGLNH